MMDALKPESSEVIKEQALMNLCDMVKEEEHHMVGALPINPQYPNTLKPLQPYIVMCTRGTTVTVSTYFVSELVP